MLLLLLLQQTGSKKEEASTCDCAARQHRAPVAAWRPITRPPAWRLVARRTIITGLDGSAAIAYAGSRLDRYFLQYICVVFVKTRPSCTMVNHVLQTTLITVSFLTFLFLILMLHIQECFNKKHSRRSTFSFISLRRMNKFA